MKMLEKGKANKIVIFSAIVGTVTLIIGIAFIYIQFLHQNKSLRETILLEREKNVLMGQIRALGRHLKVYERRILEQGRGVSWLLSKVSDMAADEHIEISSIRPGTPESWGAYTKLYVIAETVSTYHQLGRFISKIESFEKFLRIEKITVKRMDLDEGYEKEGAKFKSFDVKAYIEISTVVSKE